VQTTIQNSRDEYDQCVDLKERPERTIDNMLLRGPDFVSDDGVAPSCRRSSVMISLEHTRSFIGHRIVLRTFLLLSSSKSSALGVGGHCNQRDSRTEMVDEIQKSGRMTLQFPLYVRRASQNGVITFTGLVVIHDSAAVEWGRAKTTDELCYFGVIDRQI
jgi:hypothetical protein